MIDKFVLIELQEIHTKDDRVFYIAYAYIRSGRFCEVRKAYLNKGDFDYIKNNDYLFKDCPDLAIYFLNK